jgi:hypothetical protein
MNEQMSGQLKKPPLGIVPRWLCKMRRVYEICDAIVRFTNEETPIPAEWIDELIDLIEIQKYPRRRPELDGSIKKH